MAGGSRYDRHCAVTRNGWSLTLLDARSGRHRARDREGHGAIRGATAAAISHPANAQRSSANSASVVEASGGSPRSPESPRQQFGAT